MRPRPRVLAVPHRTAVKADIAALIVFVSIGALNHDVSVGGYFRDVAIFVACWLAAAGAFDLYKRPRAIALIGTWLTAITAGVLIRALILWHVEADDAVFLAVALVFSLLFVLAIRALVSRRA